MSIQLPRLVKWGDRGRDVLGCKRALWIWASKQDRHQYLPALGALTNEFGTYTYAAVGEFQAFHAMQVDHVIGPKTWALLEPFADADALWLIEHYAPPETMRQKIHDEHKWLLANHPYVHWAELRPVPLVRFRDRFLPITTDCSGSTIGASYGAGAPDPSGNGYSGQGSTGSFLTHLFSIARSSLRLSDLIVFGRYPGLHVVVVTVPGSDPSIFTLGHEGSPDDPREMPLSYMESYFRGIGAGATYLSRGLP